MDNFETTPFGKVEIIARTPEFGVSILHVEPGKSPCTPHTHNKTVEMDYVLEGELVCNNKTVKKGSTQSWKVGEAHGYINKSGKPARLLCTSIPPWTPEDEVKV